MRLGSCIALEVATGVLALSATALGVAFAAGAVRGDQDGQTAASTPAAVGPSVAVPAIGRGSDTVGSGSQALSATGTVPPNGTLPPDEVRPPEPPAVEIDAGVPVAALALEPTWTFLDQPDDVLLAPLRTGRVKLVKFNGGGTSLSLRLEFEDGSRAAFKPDQIHLHSVPRKEVAAYRIDRLLGLGRVPPAITRSFTVSEISSKIAAGHRPYAHRLGEEAIAKGGQLRGELSWWIPQLGSHVLEGRYRIDSGDGVDRWKKWMKVGAEIPEGERAICAQISNVTAFDFLIDNLDRWSGGNANTTTDGATLYFMDNTMAFSDDAEGHSKSHRHLQRIEVFSRGLVERLRKLDEASLRAVLEPDTAPYDRLLTDVEITALLARNQVLLAYVDGLIAKHGEDKVLAFP